MGRMNFTPGQPVSLGVKLSTQAEFKSSVSIPVYGQGELPQLDTHPAFQKLGGDDTLYNRLGFVDPDYYMLASETPGGKLIVEPGETTRTWYFSQTGATYDEIQAVEGGTVSNFWIRNQDTSGLTISPYRWGEHPDYAIHSSHADQLMNHIYQNTSHGSSNWVLFKGGETHPAPRINEKDGESALHPFLMTSYGGGRAILEGDEYKTNSTPNNIAFVNLKFTGGMKMLQHGKNILLSDMDTKELVFQGKNIDEPHERVTLRNMFVYKSVRSEPNGAGLINGYWQGDPNGSGDRKSGVFSMWTDKVLAIGGMWDHNGWGPNFQPDRSYVPGRDDQVPTKFSHNFYMGDHCFNLTLRDLICSRAASTAAQQRAGAFDLRLALVENNIFGNFGGEGGDPLNPPMNYGIMLDSFILGAGYKTTNPEVPFGEPWELNNDGGVNWHIGDTNNTEDLVLDRVIVAHGADPNNTTEVAAKVGRGGGEGIDPNDPNEAEDLFWHNWVIVNWFELSNWNTDQVNDANGGTIALWADQDQGVPAGTNDTNSALNYLLSFGTDAGKKFFDMWRFLAPKYGYGGYTRNTPHIVNWIPWKPGDGFRWDNPRNWSTNDFPGFVSGDSVDLNDGYVKTYEDLCEMNTVWLGEAGTGILHIVGGKTTVENGFYGSGYVDVKESGQFWINTEIVVGTKTLTATGGRLAFDANGITNVLVDADADAEVVIYEGASVVFDGLRLVGDTVDCGFDGDAGGTASITLSGVTEFVAGVTGFSPIQPFFSGRYGFDQFHRIKDPNVVGDVTISDTLHLNVTGLANGTYPLITNVAAVTGAFAEVTAEGNGSKDLTLNTSANEVTITIADGTGQITS